LWLWGKKVVVVGEEGCLLSKDVEGCREEDDRSE